MLAGMLAGCDDGESPGSPGTAPVYAYELEDAFPALAFDNAVDLQNAGDGSNRLFVVEKAGRVLVFANADTVASARTFLDITGRVANDGLEKGLLGLAFHPDYASNGYFFVYYTSPAAVVRVSRFAASAADPDSAVAGSERVLLDIPHPLSNHNGGQLAFGPDGYLYVAVGDGGGGGDPDDNGQDRSTLLGAILRIDVDSAAMGNYGIPPDNPFAGNSDGYREEIFAWGLRNPWRFSFDPVTGRLWAGDVGQRRFEEINIVASGGNYGWDCREGAHEYGTGPGDPGAPSAVCPSPDMIDPVWEYGRDLGNSVTGGHVYRGKALTSLTGTYICADFGSGRIWSLDPNGSGPATGTQIQTAPFLVSSFGVDESRELYVVEFDTGGGIFRLAQTRVQAD
jgi:glucose/arabinose dehydrogenase